MLHSTVMQRIIASQISIRTNARQVSLKTRIGYWARGDYLSALDPEAVSAWSGKKKMLEAEGKRLCTYVYLFSLIENGKVEWGSLLQYDVDSQQNWVINTSQCQCPFQLHPKFRRPVLVPITNFSQDPSPNLTPKPEENQNVRSPRIPT